jgi:hypothetical protein
MQSVLQLAKGWAGDGSEVESWQGKIFLIPTLSRPVLWPTQHSIQRVPGTLSVGVRQPGCEADTDLQLVPRSRIHGFIHQFSIHLHDTVLNS